MLLTPIDYLLLFIMGLFCLFGMMRGFIREVVSLGTFVVALLIASTYAEALAVIFTRSAFMQNIVGVIATGTGYNPSKPVGYVAITIAFAFIFFVVSILGSLLGYVLSGFIGGVGVLNLGNRVMGGAFGLAKGGIINLVLIFLVQLTPIGTQPAWYGSTVVREYQPAVQWLGAYMSPIINQMLVKAQQTWQTARDAAKGHM
jgi:membrane protein required for colicin V production